MTDVVFAVPVLDQIPARDLRLLLAIADFTIELVSSLDPLAVDKPTALKTISEIMSELPPLLAEYRQRFPDQNTQYDPALLPHRDPFDGDARIIAQAAADNDSWPLMAFL